MAHTTAPLRSPTGDRREPVPTTQSPTLAARRIRGLQITKVQTPQNGLGAAPPSWRTQYENSIPIAVPSAGPNLQSGVLERVISFKHHSQFLHAQSVLGIEVQQQMTVGANDREIAERCYHWRVAG